VSTPYQITGCFCDPAFARYVARVYPYTLANVRDAAPSFCKLTPLACGQHHHDDAALPLERTAAATVVPAGAVAASLGCAPTGSAAIQTFGSLLPLPSAASTASTPTAVSPAPSGVCSVQLLVAFDALGCEQFITAPDDAQDQVCISVRMYNHDSGTTF
jgi:hypothetical protein